MATGPTLARVQLAELLIATCLVGIVVIAVVTTAWQGLHTYAAGAARSETQQSARIALDRITHDIRAAGVGPETSLPAVTVAEPAKLVLQLDLNGDGEIAGNGETITWHLAGTVVRRHAGGGAQPIVNGVRALTFRYFDRDGAPTAAPQAVRAIAVALTTEPTHTMPQPLAGMSSTLTTYVRLRNR